MTAAELTAGVHPLFLLVNSPTLVAGAVYTISFNGIDLVGNPSATVNVQNITYVPATSKKSDIIEAIGYAYPQNIDYASAQETSDIQVSTTSVEVAKFTIRDGGINGIDTDPFPTTVTELALDLGANFSIIRRIALYDEFGVEVMGSEKLVSNRTVTCTGISIPCSDDGTTFFTVRVSFNTVVTDNQQFSFAITSVKAKAQESEFDPNIVFPSTSVSGNNNRIEVIASQLVFSQQPANTFINDVMVPPVALQAVDINNNLDMDFSGTVNILSSGTLSSSPSAVLALGVGVSSNIVHSAGGISLTLTTSNKAGLTEATSALFDIYETTQQVSLVIRPFITPNTADTQNNVLFIENIEFFPENSVKLIDRWGIPVKTWLNFSNYATTNADQTDFDFTSLSVGNYVCVVEFKDATTGKKRDQAQMITVLK